MSTNSVPYASETKSRNRVQNTCTDINENDNKCTEYKYTLTRQSFNFKLKNSWKVDMKKSHMIQTCN